MTLKHAVKQVLSSCLILTISHPNLRLKKYTIHVSVRSNQQKIAEGVKSFNVGEICSKTVWKDALFGVNCIIHCAARAHVMREKKIDTGFMYQV